MIHSLSQDNPTYPCPASSRSLDPSPPVALPLFLPVTIPLYPGCSPGLSPSRSSSLLLPLTLPLFLPGPRSSLYRVSLLCPGPRGSPCQFVQEHLLPPRALTAGPLKYRSPLPSPSPRACFPVHTRVPPHLVSYRPRPLLRLRHVGCFRAILWRQGSCRPPNPGS